MKHVLISSNIEQLLQETIEQCNAGRGDLSNEEQPKPFCSAFETAK